MTLPERIRVGGRFYAVSVGPDDLGLAERQRIGETDHVQRRIRISSTLPSDVQADVLIHEVLHAIAYHMNLDEDWGDRGESYVERLANGLVAVGRDNPELVRLLLLPEEVQA